MAQHPRDRVTVQLVAGLVVAALGVLFTLDNLDILSARDYLRYWPVVLLAVGIAQIVEAQTWSRALTGLVLVLVGAAILVKSLDLLDVNLWDFLPLLLVLAGGYIVWQAFCRGAPQTSVDRAHEALRHELDHEEQTASESEDTIVGLPAQLRSKLVSDVRASMRDAGLLPPASADAGSTMSGDAISESPAQPNSDAGSARAHSRRFRLATISSSRWISGIAVMGGFRRRVKSGDFQGGELTAFMGECSVDLRDATPADGEAVINVFVVMGGVVVKVPDTWNIVIEVFPFMGGVEDKTTIPPGGSGPRLILRGFVMMGGVEVKN